MFLPEAASEIDQEDYRPTESGRIDWQQLLILIKLESRLHYRASIDATTGKVKDNPLKVFFSTSLLGLFFIRNTNIVSDLQSYIYLLFFSTFSLITLGLMPSTIDVLQRHLEILHTKPISRQTLMIARMLSTLLVSAPMVSFFALVPLCASLYFYQISLATVLGLYLTLIIGTFITSSIWQVLLLLLARWFTLDSLKKIAQFTLMIIALPTCLAGMYYRSLGGIFAGPRLPIAQLYWVKYIPSTWFADLFIGDYSTLTNLERGGALALFTIAIASIKLNMEWRYQRLIELLFHPKEQTAHKPVSLRALDLIRSIPLLGQRLIKDQTYGLTALILNVTARDNQTQLQTVQLHFFNSIFFIFSMIKAESGFFDQTIIFISLMIINTALQATRHSPNANASWLFYSLPIEAKEMIKALRLLIIVRHLLLASTMVIISIFHSQPIPQAIALTITYILSVRLFIAFKLATNAIRPLSNDQKFVSPFFATIFTTMIFMFFSSSGYYLVLKLAQNLTITGIFYIVGIFGIMIVINQWLENRAATQLAKLEFAL